VTVRRGVNEAMPGVAWRRQMANEVTGDHYEEMTVIMGGVAASHLLLFGVMRRMKNRGADIRRNKRRGVMK